MPAETEVSQENHLTADSLIVVAGEPLKSLEVKDGKERVGSYAIRFSGPDQKDLQDEYFTAQTDYGVANGDGAATMFHHGIPIADGLEYLANQTFAPVKTFKDDIGIFVETVLNLSDEYQKAIADLVGQGKLKWSSATAAHLMRKAADGRILRWHPIEFSYTPTPAEPRLPAIAPLKSVTIDEKTAKELEEVFNKESRKAGKPDVVIKVGLDFSDANRLLEEVGRVDKKSAAMTEAEQAAKDAADKAAKDAADTKSLNDRVENRTQEISEIYEIGDQINDRESARQWVKDGKSLADYRAHVLTNVLKAKPVTTDSGLLGMGESDKKSYSLLRALHQMATKGRLEGVEKEAHEACVKAYGREDLKGFLVPEDVSRGFGRRSIKAQNVTTATAGGFLVQTDMGPMIELLRNRPVVVDAGATTLNGLVGDLALPVHVSGATAYWVSETGALTDSQSVFGQKKLTPRRLGATIPYSTQFLAQASIDAEAFIRDDAVRVLALEVDRAALLGSGVGGEPLGIANTVGINATVTYGDAAIWGDVIEHETGVAVDNADIGSMAFVLDAASVGKWKTALKVATYGGTGYLIDGMSANGYPVYRTNQIASTHQSFFGNWAQLVIARWAGMEVIVDPYALKKSGQVEITFNELLDLVVRQPLAFNVSTDSAAQ
jgi:HK97 family phage major capsid protein